ncbi:MAG TPA: hypothetical protein VNN81_03450, partial [Bradyrhizobium sp.]|nr:hypothetical protein [Bradyrhizobium sp.]
RIEIQHPVPDFSLPLRWYDLAHECPFSEVRSTFQHPLYELRKTKGTGKSQILVPLFDLRFLVGLAGCAAGTSNRRHQDPWWLAALKHPGGHR